MGKQTCDFETSALTNDKKNTPPKPYTKPMLTNLTVKQIKVDGGTMSISEGCCAAGVLSLGAS